jgi:hypothetical protein
MTERNKRFRAVNNAANEKKVKYNDACNGLALLPFAVDVCGTLQSDASKFLL